MPDRPRTVPDLLLAALRADPARPFVTFYDDRTGERTELSVATYANWVAKTANLLRDELGVAPGDQVAVLLRPHWQTLAWLTAAWAAGAAVVDEAAGAGSRAAAATQARIEPALRLADDVVAVSLHPFAAACPDPLPPGVLDFGVEVRGHGDALVVTAPSGLALRTATAGATPSELVARGQAFATSVGLASGGRLLVESGHDEAGTFGPVLDGLLAALAVGGSLVLCTHLDVGLLDRRTAAEHVDVVARIG